MDNPSLKLLSKWQTETKWSTFCRRHFQTRFLEWKLFHFISNFIEICSHGLNYQSAIIGSNDGLAPNRRQAIIGTKGGIVHWRIYASLGLNELTQFGMMSRYGDIDLGQHCKFDMVERNVLWFLLPIFLSSYSTQVVPIIFPLKCFYSEMAFLYKGLCTVIFHRRGFSSLLFGVVGQQAIDPSKVGHGHWPIAPGGNGLINGQVRLGGSVRNCFSVRTSLNSTGYCKLPR